MRQECMPPQQNLAFGDDELAVVFGDVAGLGEGLGDQFRVALGVLVPGLDRGGTVDADPAGGADAEIAHLQADLAGLADLGQELTALLLGAHGGAAAGAGPDRGDEGADLEAIPVDVVGHPPHGVEVAVDVEVRRGDEEVDAVELLAVDLGLGGELEQGVERDDRLAVGGALADDAGPHGVVKLGVGVGHDRPLAERVPGSLVAHLDGDIADVADAGTEDGGHPGFAAAGIERGMDDAGGDE